MNDNFDDYFEFIDVLEGVMNVERLPKRYIRDAENPLEHYADNEFSARYRFKKNTVVNIILPLVQNDLEKVNNRGLPIPPIMKLLICLRFFATGAFQIVAGDLRKVSQASVSLIVKSVSTIIARNLATYIKFPETEQLQRLNIRKFYGIANFPSVAGCIDCTHIKITNPGGDNAEVFRNRKGYFSLNVQVVAGPSMEIMDIVVRHPGSVHESLIFARSSIRVRFERGEILGLLGDSGYACKSYLLTPVLNPGNIHEENYNRSHIRTRNLVERVFGLWKRRFPCLQRGLGTKIETTVAIICAAAVLHNIALQQNDRLNVNQEGEVLEIPEEFNRNFEMGLEFRRQFIITHF